MNAITYLTKESYMELVKKYEGGHWTPETIDQRWEYHSRVVELVKSLNVSGPDAILEMGTMGISCVNNSDTIDYLERWDFPGKKPTYVHDSRITPWPIKNKQYEVFIALRVFQHLTPFQREATKEAMRIARKVIIAVPDIYRNKEISGSKGITYADFVDFLDGIHPTLYFPTRDEYIYYWDVENPSTLNLETVMRRILSNTQQSLVLDSQKKTKKNFLFEKMRNIKRILTGKGLHLFWKNIDSHVQVGSTISENHSSQRSSKSANRHIEFVGPAGIGKSTVCNETRKYAIGDWGYRESLPNILIRYEGEVGESHYLRLLYSKVEHFENYSLSGYQKLRLIGYFSDVLLKDMAINNSRSLPKKFLLDEGLCQNFFEEMLDLSDADLEMLVVNRALVFMQAKDVYTVVDQIRKRERETGQMVAYYVGLNDNALRDIIELNISLFNAFINRVETLGVPVCRIFVEDGMQVNVKHVLDFEKRLIELS